MGEEGKEAEGDKMVRKHTVGTQNNRTEGYLSLTSPYS